MRYDVFPGWPGNLKTAFDLAEINVRAAEKLFDRQAELASDMLEAPASYLKMLSECRDLNALAEAQQEYWRNLTEKSLAAGKANLDVLEDAQKRAVDVFEEAFKDVENRMQSSVRDFQSRAQSMASSAASATDEMATAGKKAAKKTG